MTKFIALTEVSVDEQYSVVLVNMDNILKISEYNSKIGAIRSCIELSNGSVIFVAESISSISSNIGISIQ